MLSEKLKNLYTENRTLADEFPFDEYYPLLRNFLVQEINLGAELLSPYRFAVTYGLSPRSSVRFFLGLADEEEIIYQYYKYECEECNTTNIIKDEAELLDFKCKNCGFEDYLVKTEHLSEVKLLFKISGPLLEEIRNNLKELPLTEVSNFSSTLDEGTLVSLSTLTEIANDGGRPISKLSESLQNRIEEYRQRAFL